MVENLKKFVLINSMGGAVIPRILIVGITKKLVTRAIDLFLAQTKIIGFEVWINYCIGFLGSMSDLASSS